MNFWWDWYVRVMQFEREFYVARRTLLLVRQPKLLAPCGEFRRRWQRVRFGLRGPGRIGIKGSSKTFEICSWHSEVIDKKIGWLENKNIIRPNNWKFLLIVKFYFCIRTPNIPRLHPEIAGHQLFWAVINASQSKPFSLDLYSSLSVGPIEHLILFISIVSKALLVILSSVFFYLQLTNAAQQRDPKLFHLHSVCRLRRAHSSHHPRDTCNTMEHHIL